MDIIKIPDNTCKLHPIAIHTIDTFDYDVLKKSNVIKDFRVGDYLSECISAFDIETTTYDKDLSWMYVWQWCFLINGYYHVLIGRTWEAFTTHMDNIRDVMCGTRLITWVHNLGFEYQNMINFIRPHTVFAVKPRMPIKVTIDADNHEFRCSWKLTNMTLEKATEKEAGIKYCKYPDKIDYRKIRYPDTPLEREELVYDVLDVVSLCDLIRCKLVNEGDSLATIPLTSTGYVRRACRRRVRAENKNYREEVFLKNTLNPDTYLMLKNAARGGNTHANRYFVKSIL